MAPAGKAASALWRATPGCTPGRSTIGWAESWPAEIDVFLAVGEIALCVAYLDGWPARQRIWPWATALIGLAVVRRGKSATSRPSLVSQSTCRPADRGHQPTRRVRGLVCRAARAEDDRSTDPRPLTSGCQRDTDAHPHRRRVPAWLRRRRTERRWSSGPARQMTRAGMASAAVPTQVPACCETPPPSTSTRPLGGTAQPAGPGPAVAGLCGTL